MFRFLSHFIYFRINNMNMNSREQFFVHNYSVFGSATGKRCGYTKKEIEALKTKYKEEGIYMLPIRETAQYPMSDNNKNHTYNAIGFAIACLDQEDQNKITQLAKNIPEPETLIDEAIALQEFRLGMGMRNEQEQGHLLETTETAMMNLVNMVQAKKTIMDGNELNLNVNNTISSLLDEIDDDDNDDTINIDMDEIHKKEQLKEVREQDFQNLINDI